MNRPFTVLTLLLLLAFASNAQTPLTDSLLQIVALNKRDTVHIKALNALGIEYGRRDMKRQREFLYAGIKLAKELHSDYITNFYSMLAASHQNGANLDSAMVYLSMLEQAHKNNLKDRRAYENFNNTAGLIYKNAGRPREALPYMKRAVEMTRDSASKAGQMLNLGNVYMNLSDLKNATAWHLKSLALFEKVGNKRGQSFVYQSLGNDYWKMLQYEKARIYFERSLNLKTELKDIRGVLSATASLGTVSRELGNYEDARKKFEDVLKQSTELGWSAETGHALYELGILHKKMKQKDRAVDYYNRAIVIAKQSGDSVWVADMRASLLDFETEHKSKEALEYGFLTSLRQFEEQGDKIGISNAHQGVADFYASNGEFEKAFKHLSKSRAFSDSARGTSVDEQLRALEEQYANEKRDREMAMMKKDQEVETAEHEKKQAVMAGVIVGLISLLTIGLILVNRSRAIAKARRVAEMEMMRNAIARDLHDDIGSTLSSINILSQLAIKGDAETASKHFQKIAEQSGRMMENMSDIVWSISPGNDSLDQVVMKMKEFAAEILEPKNISYSFTGTDSLSNTTMSLEKRKNLFLIFKEAVNNAAKYSGATNLEISFIRQGNTLSFSVADNGGGFEPTAVRSGNGLKNMKERAKALSARFDFVTRIKEGTRIALEVPLT